MSEADKVNAVVSVEAKEWWSRVFLHLGEDIAPRFRSAYLAMAGYDAGAASRDAEVAALKAENLRLESTAANFYAVTVSLKTELDALRDELRKLAARWRTTYKPPDDWRGTTYISDAVKSCADEIEALAGRKP
jgi:hypothetical protein